MRKKEVNHIFSDAGIIGGVVVSEDLYDFLKYNLDFL